MTMGPGRELDALIAEKVMGWAWEDAPASGCNILYKPPHHLKAGLVYYDGKMAAVPSEYIGKWIDAHYWAGGEIGTTKLPDYSTNILAAWEVVEAMKKKGYHWWFAATATPREFTDVHSEHKTNLACIRLTCCSQTIVKHEEDTMPFAICCAALKALELNLK